MFSQCNSTRDSETLCSNQDSLRTYPESLCSNSESLCSNSESLCSNSESLCSNPVSSAAANKDGFRDNAFDFDLCTNTYLNELLESGLKEERFRIDRKKLEDMLQVQRNSCSELESAEEFFERVMLETATDISWPSKLKISAKSKKDPHVKIVGKPEAVQLAKEKILGILDTKKNRVTLKMDVSHTDHSYSIGKGGFKIQQVMEETGCHIHFPDSNRNSTAEKSNQVSIAGQATGVELARAKIRDLLPLVFTFKLPDGQTLMPGEECSPAISHIQQTYSFNVTFRATGPGGLGPTVLVVRGCQRHLSRLKQGLSLLMEYITGYKTLPVMGFMKTEIAAQHHQFVMGLCNTNVQTIMNKTGATLIFPDASSQPFDGDSPSQSVSLLSGHVVLRSKSTVFILGSFDSVCLAWQELLKCLPLVLMFDLKEGQELDPVMVNNFMEAFNISIMVRPKMKENTKSVLIRGAEKDSKVLFQVRKEILGLEGEDTYPMSPSLRNSVRMPTIETHRKQPQIPELPIGLVTKQGQIMSLADLSMLTNIIQRNPQIVGLLNNLSPALPTNALEVFPPAPVQNKSDLNLELPHPINSKPSEYLERNIESWINLPDRSYAYESGMNVSNYLQKDMQLPADDDDSGIFMPKMFRNNFYNGYESKSEMSSRPQSSASSTSSADTPEFKSPRFTKNEHPSNNFAVNANVPKHLADYKNKKVLASKVMQQSVDGVRTPNEVWSGYGFSKSMPDFTARAAKHSNANSGSITEYLEDNASISNLEMAAAKAWNSDLPGKDIGEPVSPFAQSNFWENVPRRENNPSYNSIQNLDQLLTVLSLDNYSEVFANQEIDLQTFFNLTESDLHQLNISYGARRKMLAAISSMKERNEGPSRHFRAAPGAERKTYFRYSRTPEEISERI